jgi:AcrR family transcriptional regulator
MTRGLRGPYMKGEERRSSIVATAAQVFAVDGFDRTTLKRVAELVGVREATLFHYFSSKQELQQAVLAETDKEQGDVGTNSLLGTGYLLAVAAQDEHRPGLTSLHTVALATASIPTHVSHRYFKERYELLVGELAREVTERQTSGEYRNDVDPQWAGRLLIGVLDGLRIQWLYNRDVSVPDGLHQALTLLKRH